MAFKRQHFAYQHPLFGRSKEDKAKENYKFSVYFLWWEFLRRNADYKRCCERNGRGTLGGIYADFGNVFDVDFKTWWQTNDRGASLFAEQLPPRFQVVSNFKEATQDPKIVYLQVPLSLPKRHLIREFQKILKLHHRGRRGIRANARSTAKYPTRGHVDSDAIQKCLRVYDAKIQNPRMPLWKIAQVAQVVPKTRFVNDEDLKGKDRGANKKLILANTSNRLHKKALKIISNVALGRFPDAI